MLYRLFPPVIFNTIIHQFMHEEMYLAVHLLRDG